MWKNIILANGDMPNHPYSLQLLQNAQSIVCCDGAIENLLQLGFMPSAIVGDGDSILEERYQQFADIIFIDKNQEINDLQKSIRYCISKNMETIAILGGFGLREDHALANLGILLMYGKQIRLTMVTNSGIFIPLFQTATIPSQKGQKVSIFSFDKNTILSFSQLRYPVEKRSFSHLWEGSLNECIADSFTITLHNEGAVAVYLCF